MSAYCLQIIISRKAEVRRLEEQGEDGMVHSFLSGLPDLCDVEDEVVDTKEGDAGDIKVELDGEMVHVKAEADDETVEAEVPQRPEKVPLEEWHGLTSNVPVDGSIPSPAPETASKSETELSLEYGESELSTFSSMQENGFDLVSSPPSSFDGLQEQDGLLKPTLETTTPGTHAHTPMSTLSPSPSTSPPRSPSPTPSISSSISSDSVSSSNFLPKRLKIPLSTLLSQADALYLSYPPTHPSLALSEIMGPQSVVFTWSESEYLGRGGDDRELDEDDEAESMVLQPELVVHPYIEPSSPLSSSDEGDEKSKRRRHRRKKLQKPKSRLFETRTMVVSAVVVLGVSMAVYGIRAHGHAHAHGHGGLGIRGSWRKIGGVLLGASERIVDGW
jgi:TBC1 domain family member 20